MNIGWQMYCLLFRADGSPGRAVRDGDAAWPCGI